MSTSLPRRKKVRKGTKSCWECKRRKVRCIPSKDGSVCAGCLERRISCLSQEYVEVPPLPPQHDGESPSLAQRMARVESLLETLVARITQGQPEQSSVLSISNESQYIAFGSQADASFPAEQPEEALRQKLAALLLCQEDVNFLLASSHGWWLIQQHTTPHISDATTQHDVDDSLNVAAVSKFSAVTITRALLVIAICIQQLSPEIDRRKFRCKMPLRDIMTGIMDFVVGNVTSDDNLMGSIEGVECLSLQAVYEVNAGNLRRSWVTFRKAITIGQLLGLHNMTVKSSQEDMKRRHLWYHIARGERYLSTLLGLPSSTGSAAFPLLDADNDTWLSPENVYHKRLYHIAGLILARNQSDSTHTYSTTQRIGEQLASFAAEMPPAWWEVATSIPTTRTKEAFAQFERVMCQIWHFQLEMLVYLPFMLRAATDRRYEHSHISCLNASRNLIKRWISIRECSSNAILFSNLLEFTAFTAATTLLLGILASPKTANFSHILEEEQQEDFRLVETVVENLERLKQQGAGMSVGNQSISVIRTLQRFVNPSGGGGNLPDRLRLEIPFFGVIMLARHGAVLQPLEGERILGANSSQSATSSSSLLHVAQSAVPSFPIPGTSRTSLDLVFDPTIQQLQDTVGTDSDIGIGSDGAALQVFGGHFQLPQESGIRGILDSSEWCFQESDMISFDSLIDTDLVGNWTF